MKWTILIVASMAIVAVQAGSVQKGLTVADKTLLERQRFILEILLHVDHDLQIKEWIEIGDKLLNDKSLYTEYDEWMTKFYKSNDDMSLLPRGEFFSVMSRVHDIQSRGLFSFFYNAKDWDTFVHNVAWARLNVNEGMYVYALTMAVIHRDDMQGIILPQIYEILPQMFLNSKYILAAEKFDWEVWTEQRILRKEFGIFSEQGRYQQTKVWEWWKELSLEDGWQEKLVSMFRANIDVMQKDPMWSTIYKNLNMAWIPADYTRSIEIWNDDSILSYFTEDVGWNAYWYYLNLDYSKILAAKPFNLDKDRRGEWWIYNVQQMLVRYGMERLSHGLPEIEMLSWHEVVKTGYNPQLIAYNGNSFSVRKNYWHIESYQNLEVFNKIMNIARRIQDVVDSGRLMMRNGTVVDLTQPESIEIIGDLLQGNVDSLDWYFFGPWWHLSSLFLSGGQYDDFTVAPNVLMNYETMLRDPLTYSLLKKIVGVFKEFKYQLHPYTKEELLLPGVEFLKVEVSKLATYFHLVDVDVTTLSNDKMTTHDGRLVWDKALMARQMRLNHQPFNFTFQVKVDAAQKAVVRIFLGSIYDRYGQKSNALIDRENFMELDAFVADLALGENMFHRSSEDFTWTSDDPITYSEWYNYLSMSYDGQYQFLQNVSQSHSLFPNRLILPYGSSEGMPVALFFIMSSYNSEYQQYSTYDPSWQSGIGSGVRHIDNRAFGFPLDRKIEDWDQFSVPNMHLENTKIYHESGLGVKWRNAK